MTFLYILLYMRKLNKAAKHAPAKGAEHQAILKNHKICYYI